MCLSGRSLIFQVSAAQSTYIFFLVLMFFELWSSEKLKNWKRAARKRAERRDAERAREVRQWKVGLARPACTFFTFNFQRFQSFFFNFAGFLLFFLLTSMLFDFFQFFIHDFSVNSSKSIQKSSSYVIFYPKCRKNEFRPRFVRFLSILKFLIVFSALSLVFTDSLLLFTQLPSNFPEFPEKSPKFRKKLLISIIFRWPASRTSRRSATFSPSTIWSPSSASCRASTNSAAGPSTPRRSRAPTTVSTSFSR